MLRNNRALTDAVGKPFMEMFSRANIHLADLVLGVGLQFLLLLLRVADVYKQLLHLAQLFLQRSSACGGGGIQLISSQQRQATQLVAAAGNVRSESRRDKLWGRACEKRTSLTHEAAARTLRLCSPRNISRSSGKLAARLNLRMAGLAQMPRMSHQQ